MSKKGVACDLDTVGVQRVTAMCVEQSSVVTVKIAADGCTDQAHFALRLEPLPKENAACNLDAVGVQRDADGMRRVPFKEIVAESPVVTIEIASDSRSG